MTGQELREALLNGTPGVYHSHTTDGDIPYDRIRELRYRVIKGRVRVFAVLVDCRREDTTYLAVAEWLESMPPAEPGTEPETPPAADVPKPGRAVVEISVVVGGQEMSGQIIRKGENYAANVFDTADADRTDRFVYQYTDAGDVYDVLADYIEAWGRCIVEKRI